MVFVAQMRCVCFVAEGGVVRWVA